MKKANPNPQKTIQRVGIDVSHLYLDFAYQNQEKWIKGRLPNTQVSIRKWLKKFDPKDVQLVFEPTGTYHDKLMNLAAQAGLNFAMVNSRLSFHYTHVQGHTHRNDAQAAQTLAILGDQLNLASSPLPSAEKQKRKQLHMALSALAKQRQALLNQIHTLEQLFQACKKAQDALEKVIETVDNQIKELEEELHQLSDEKTQEVAELIGSVVGIGPKSVLQILRYLGDLSQFENPKQVIKFVGVAPVSHSSGTSVRTRPRISKQGPSQLRATLFMAAMTARVHNRACKAMYERLRAKGKPHKLVMMALVGKLLKQIFAVVSTKTTFDNQKYVSEN